MRRSRFISALAAAAIGVAMHIAPAAAQPAGPNPDPGPSSSSTYRPPSPSAPLAQIEAAIVAHEAERFGACAANDRALTLVSGGIHQPRLTTERRVREGGVTTYRYVYSARGCGQAPRRHNVEVLAHQGLSPMVLVLPMGTTAVTSQVMQGVVQGIFTPMMSARYPDCPVRRLKILEANVTRGTPYQSGQTWAETWSYDACGGRGLAEVTFAYDGEGLRTTANVTPTG